MRALKILLACMSFFLLAGVTLTGNGTCQNQILPAYVYPLAAGTQAPWTTIMGKTNGAYNSPLQSGQTRWIIMEPPLTSSDVYNSDYGTVIEEAHDLAFAPPGTKVLLYINLGFGAVSEQTIFTELSNAAAFYNNVVRPENNPPFTATLTIDGIFFDQMAYTQSVYAGEPPAAGNPTSNQQFLTDVLNYAITNGPGNVRMDYWFNPGFWPDQVYLSLNTVASVTTRFTVENSWVNYSTQTVPEMPAYIPNYGAWRFGSIVNTITNNSQVETAAQLAQSVSTGTVFITDVPYATGLPTFWNTLYIPQVNGGCCLPLTGRN